MPRIARIIAPHFPHHVTQRDNNHATDFLMMKRISAYSDAIRPPILIQTGPPVLKQTGPVIPMNNGVKSAVDLFLAHDILCTCLDHYA